MMNKRLEMLLLVGLFVGMSVGLTGAQQGEKSSDYHFSVGVSVTSSDAATKTSIESYVKRELRSLGDVKIEEDSHWKIRIVAMEAKTKTSGRHNGYSMAAAITKSHQIDDFFIDQVAEEYVRDLLKVFNRPVEEHVTLYLYLAGSDQLRWMCEQVVADFDTNQLEPGRRAATELIKEIENIR